MSPVIVALDFPDADSALALARQLDPQQCRLKIGKELFTRCGPGIVEQVQALGFEVFLDLKFHDIPNTVAKAVIAAADLGVWMLNVHATGGRSMMLAAREALEQRAGQRPRLIAVTLLTSMDVTDLIEVGISATPQQMVQRLAALAQECGLDGVVCSAREAEVLKSMLGRDFQLVTPGIRPASAEQGDQKRVMTPQQAIAAGSDFLVIGRPITAQVDPLAALTAINRELAEGP